MGCEIRLLGDRRFALTTVSGEISDADLRSHVLELNDVAGDMPDLREPAGARERIASEAFTVAGPTQGASPEMPRPERRLAVLVASPLVYGLALALALIFSPWAAAQTVDDPRLDNQVSAFVRRIHEDRRGHMWFGTNGDGVVRHDGASLQTFGPREGFGGSAVRGVVEEADGTLWFGTENGLTRFDGRTFTQVPVREGPVRPGANDVWALHLDRRGTIWVGTLGGVSTFDGEGFTPFPLPETVQDESRGVTGPRLVHAITEDRLGRMWFATAGGVLVWDGETFDRVSAADGLCGDVVNDVLAARDGSMWFATHHHGVCRLRDGEFISYGPDDGVQGVEAWSLFEDSRGHVWFPTEGYGVYRFDGEAFTNFAAADGLASRAVQCVDEDRRGRIWVGGHRGLFRRQGDRFVNLTRDLPWP